MKSWQTCGEYSYRSSVENVQAPHTKTTILDVKLKGDSHHWDKCDLVPYLSTLELWRFAIENVAGLDPFRKHPYRPIEHSLDVARHLDRHDVIVEERIRENAYTSQGEQERALESDTIPSRSHLPGFVGEHLRLAVSSRPHGDLRKK